MLANEDISRIYHHAYLPEQLPEYVKAVSAAEPHLMGPYLCFTRQRHLTFIGYPLWKTAMDGEQAYGAACNHFQPSTVAIIAPNIWLPPDACEIQPADSYYLLDLPLDTVDAGVAYMLRRAEREVKIIHGSFGREHKKLIKNFLSERRLNTAQRSIFKRIPRYLKSSPSVRLLEARKQEALVAFTIVDLGSADHAFYMFCVRSDKVHVPGAADLLFREMVDLAHAEGKKTINLGLGINSGIRRFKEKWGATPFLPYNSAIAHRGPVDWKGLARKL